MVCRLAARGRRIRTAGSPSGLPKTAAHSTEFGRLFKECTYRPQVELLAQDDDGGEFVG
jgi:hypothetical protein